MAPILCGEVLSGAFLLVQFLSVSIVTMVDYGVDVAMLKFLSYD